MWSGSKPLPFGPDGAERLLHRRVQGRGLRLMARVGAMALAAAVLSAGALNLATILAAPQHEIVQSFATETTPQAWTEINHPIALYDLSGTEFAKLPRIARARRHQPDGAREDMLTFGALGLPKPFLRLSVLRTTGHIGAAQDNSGPDSAAEPFIDDLARLAGADNESVTELHGEAAISTRLGAMTIADIRLWDDGVPTPCLGFRGFPGGSDGLRILGFACGIAGKPIGRSALACTIDRIDLLSAGDDGRLRSIFVAAEREAASSCSEGRIRSTGGLMTALGARRTWLDHDADLPPLRGLFEASNNRH